MELKCFVADWHVWILLISSSFYFIFPLWNVFVSDVNSCHAFLISERVSVGCVIRCDCDASLCSISPPLLHGISCDDALVSSWDLSVCLLMLFA